MKNRTTTILLVLFFGGLLLLWGLDTARIPTAEQRERMSGRVLPALIEVSTGEIDRVEITGGGEHLEFARRGPGWQMVQPVDALADRSQVETLIANLKALARSPDAGTIQGSADSFGLAPPERVVRLFGQDPTRSLAALEVGRTVDQRRYVRPVGREGIEVADALKLAQVDQPAVAWRERSLFDVSPLDVATLTVSGPGRDLKIGRKQGGWRVLQPIQVPADEAKLEGVLADLTALKVTDGASGFVADNVRDLARYGLAPPRLTITLTPARPPAVPREIQVGAPVPDRPDRAYARRADQDDVVLIDPKPLADLGTRPQEFRSRHVSDLDLSKVDYLEIQAGKTRHVLARGPQGWVVDEPEPGPADPQAVQALLTQLAELQAGEFLDPAQVGNAGLDPPRFVVKVWQGGMTPTESGQFRVPITGPEVKPALALQIGRQDALRNVVYARSEGEPGTILALPDTLVEVLPRGPMSYLDRTILSPAPGPIDRISLTRAGTTSVVAAPAGDPRDWARWRMVEPVEAPADATSVQLLTALLSRLRAENLVAPKDRAHDLSRFGLREPILTASWTTRPGSAVAGPTQPTQTLQVGAEVPGQAGSRFATASASRWIFTLGPQAVRVLEAELHDRHVLSLSADQIERLELRWGTGRHQTFTRREGSAAEPAGWTRGPGSDPGGLDEAEINILVSTLTNVTALQFLQYRGPLPAEAELTPARLGIEIHRKGESRSQVLRLGRLAQPQLRFATNQPGDSGPVFLLDDATWSPWISPPGSLPDDLFEPPSPGPRHEPAIP